MTVYEKFLIDIYKVYHNLEDAKANVARLEAESARLHTFIDNLTVEEASKEVS